MLTKLKSYIDAVNRGYKIWTGAMIYVASFLFAFKVAATAFTPFLLEGFNFLILIGAGVLSSVVSFLLYKRTPKRFPLWDHFLKLKIRSLYDFLFPPFSTFLMSVALFTFISHFSSPSFQVVWQKSLEEFPEIVENIAFYFVALVVFMLIIFVPPILLLVYGTKKEKRIHFSKSVAIIVSFIYAIVVSYWIRPLDEETMHIFAEKIVIFFLGFIPLHWFFELYIHSIFPIKGIKTFFKEASKKLDEKQKSGF